MTYFDGPPLLRYADAGNEDQKQHHAKLLRLSNMNNED
jgi:hypothetical protein